MSEWCSIAKERGRVLYENYLPLGLRFKIDFANVDSSMQDDYSATFYGKDFFSMVAALNKLIQDYDGIPRLRRDESNRRISTHKRRTNKFTTDYEEKKEDCTTKNR